MNIGGIYAFLNLIDDKIYVGSAKNFYKRYHIHKSMLNNNRHDSSYFQRAWNKYGQINFLFVILEHCEENKLEEREQYWLDATRCYDRLIGYNSRRKANNNSGIIHSQETKNKISEAKMGIRISEEIKIKMSKSSANKNSIRWPCADGFKCKCEACKDKRRTRNREHMQEWREANREKYNSYSRNREKQIKDGTW